MKKKDALEFTPIIYQRIVNKKEEYRVVVVDGKDFAVSSLPSESSIDIREENKTGDQKDKLLGFMNRLGVESCGADYVIDNNGNGVFLEANISSAWWWVEGS